MSQSIIFLIGSCFYRIISHSPFKYSVKSIIEIKNIFIKIISDFSGLYNFTITSFFSFQLPVGLYFFISLQILIQLSPLNINWLLLSAF